MPPLRDRLDDIDDLVRHFFNIAAKEGLGSKQIDGAALARMRQHSWPGNVRELENVVRRLAALYPQDVITKNIADDELRKVTVTNIDEGESAPSTQSLSLIVEALVKDALSGVGEKPRQQLYQDILHQMEKPLISSTLAFTGGNQIKASEILGLNRNTLRKKIKELDLQIYKSS